MKRLWLIIPALMCVVLLHALVPLDKPAPSLVPAHVSRVIDGDTIELSDGTNVRYIGVNTPETVDPDQGIQCYGPQAHERNAALVEGQDVQLMYGSGETYGRKLAYVYVHGVMINALLVREGYASVMTVPPNDQLAATFERLAVLARGEGLGLWAACSGV